ncbi:GntR family transcriptional regulator [Faecalicoccus pleomorphus]|uniref:GntR family transcriptional regulator n=1 Tax=Faecalicoccus pleomorphus TaxID=1323 RepID=UPI0024322FAF|nr:GntR family transcriptional regulator [Faecalicoccus pleomorphus]
MHLIINHSSMVPIYEQIVEQIKEGILKQELKENYPLPSVRTLSKELKISALTVKKAYDALESEGFICTVHGKGSYIAPVSPQLVWEEQRKELEQDLEGILQKAKRFDITKAELKDLFLLLLEESSCWK